MLKIPDMCTGCQACYNVCPYNCITMKENEEGFLYPSINQDECVGCNKCDRVCPVLNRPDLSHNTQIYAVKNKNEDQRLNSTSGGMFWLLSEYVIQNDGVVIGAVYDENYNVKHTMATCLNDLKDMQGAKYIQSEIGNIYRRALQELKKERWVLFSGTPCQCAGIKKFIGKEYSKLVLVDLVCHGVPSYKVWEKYVNSRAAKENNGMRPLRINMRSKISGWSRYMYSSEFDYGNGKVTYISFNEDPFLQAFTKDLCLRNSCSSCSEKGVERCADFTLGDYWGVWDQYPEWDDNKGISLVMVHSDKAKKIMSDIKDKIEYFEISKNEACSKNGSICYSAINNIHKEEFLRRIEKEDISSVLDDYILCDVRKESIFGKIQRTCRRFLKR